MLFLVATPIGNLGDMSQRALDTLRSVDLIASEDTRHTGMLLKRFEIDKPQISFHEHNEDRAVQKIMQMLGEGKSVAVVSDAGTPGISDPGFSLVRRAIAEDVKFTMMPGPSAFVMALVLSGLPSHSFTFRGFAPRKPGARRRFLETDVNAPHTLIFYESPYRVAALIEDALFVFGDRNAALANDLTKMFERVDRGSLSSLLALVRQTEPKGEYVLVVEGKTDEGRKTNDEHA
jgi:16S rRNA (cytidine1402-2'-O)-methyltransferase